MRRARWVKCPYFIPSARWEVPSSHFSGCYRNEWWSFLVKNLLRFTFIVVGLERILYYIDCTGSGHQVRWRWAYSGQYIQRMNKPNSLFGGEIPLPQRNTGRNSGRNTAQQHVLRPVGNMAVKHPKIKLKNSLFLYFFLGLRTVLRCCVPWCSLPVPSFVSDNARPASILLVSRATVLPWRDLMTATGLSTRVSCLPTRPRGACTRTRACGQQDVIFLNDKIRRRHTRVVADT